MLTRKDFGLKAIALGGLAAALLAAMPAAHAEDKVVVFAAASLKDALDAVNKACEADVGEAATISYAASSALAKQIEGGAPADVFISADLDWMKYLSDKKLTKPDTEVKLLGNEIVLVAPKDSSAEIKIEKGFDLSKLIGDGKLAMGDFKAVPAGKYGKAALEKLGSWAAVKDRIAQAESVRAALLLVSRGEAPLGIVYATDAAVDANVRIVATFPADSHPAIVYPIALTRDTRNPDTSVLLAYLRGPSARAAFEKQGFTVLNRPAATAP